MPGDEGNVDLIWAFDNITPIAIIDILLVALLFYGVSFFIRGTQAVALLRGVIVLIAFVVVITNVFVSPASSAACLEAATPVVAMMRANPENVFVGASVHPSDKGHIRLVHGWKKDTQWFVQTIIEQEWFKKWLGESEAMAIKPSQ